MTNLKLQKIKSWVELEAENAEPSNLFVSICDELTLIKTLENQLHNHSWLNQKTFMLLNILENERPGFKFMLKIARELKPNLTEEEWLTHVREKIIALEALKNGMALVDRAVEKIIQEEPGYAQQIDSANDRFYCYADMAIIRQINNSIEYMEKLFSTQGISI